MLESIQEIENKNTDIKVSVYKTFNSSSSCTEGAAADMVQSDVRLEGCAGPVFGSEMLYFVFDYACGEKRIICVCDQKSWEISLPYWNSSRYPYVKWTDIRVDDNKFIRNIGDYKFYVEKGVVSYWEKYYHFSDMLMSYNDKVQNHKIGSLDLETYSSQGNGYGQLQVYAGGCALSDGYNAFYRQ